MPRARRPLPPQPRDPRPRSRAIALPKARVAVAVRDGVGWIFRIHDPNARETWHRQLEIFQPLVDQRVVVEPDSGDIAAWPGERPGCVWPSLPFRALPRMGQKEESRCVGSDAGGRGGLKVSRCPNNPEHHCRYEADGK
jgi:hypothetical protein